MILLMIFLKTFSGHILVDVTGEDGEGTWNKPPGWSGLEAAFSHSFDASNGLVSWEGTVQRCNVPHVPGKVMVNTIQISSV